MTILFEPKFNIGDIVFLKLNPEKKFTVDGYKILQLNANNEVSYFSYLVLDDEGTQYGYGEKSLDIFESVDKT